MNSNVQAEMTRLRHLMASEPSLGPLHGLSLGPLPMLALGQSDLDAALGGGLSFGAFHEIAPQSLMHLGAAAGFALGLASMAARSGKTTLFIQTDFAGLESGSLYGPGLDLFGLRSARLVIVRVKRPVDALFAMEEALKCPGLGCVVAELTGDAAIADLTATRRLTLAAREGRSLGLLLRHRLPLAASAAMTRWSIAARPGIRDRFGGLGVTSFLLSLTKNRRGPCGEWILHWDHHARAFFDAAHSLGMAETAFDRSDRTPLRHAG